jgi:2-dehydro-3-deoxyphosphogluconate aldolase/(4S)-4-hydroxy-2-oxoglutarate aldolase
MSEILNRLAFHRLIPVIALDRAADAGPLADALAAGGLPVAEVTFRTQAAESAIAEMSRRTNVLVGAGTVLDVDTVKRAVEAGAKFIVSPGFSEKVVSYCLEQKIPITPGCVTPTEIQMALEYGINTIKFFPAEAVGGIKTLKAFAAVFGHVRFIPTGGITELNLPDYLSFAPVLACGGSWMVSKQLLQAGDFARITAITAQAVAVTKRGKFDEPNIE